MKEAVFLGVLFVLLIFNWVYIYTTPDTLNTMTVGAINSLLVSVIPLVLVGGVQILGVGLNSASIARLFGIAVLLNVFFTVNVAGFPLGLGFINNVVDAFGADDAFGIGTFIAGALAVTGMVSGLMIINSD